LSCNKGRVKSEFARLILVNKLIRLILIKRAKTLKSMIQPFWRKWRAL
jgi:hypothetical protein